MFDHGFLTGNSLTGFREALDHAAEQEALQGEPQEVLNMLYSCLACRLLERLQYADFLWCACRTWG